MRSSRLVLVLASCLAAACGSSPRIPARGGGEAGQLAAPRDAELGDPADLVRVRGAKRRREADLARAREKAIAVELYAIAEAERDGREIDPALAPALEADRRRAEDAAIAGYARLVDDPELATWPLRPHALSTLAQMLRERGDDDAALDRYRELVAAYPRASDAAAAHLAIAEIAFAHEELRDALRSCDAALATPGLSDDQRAATLYMKAWILRGLGDASEPHALERAMDALRQVVALSAHAGGGSKPLAESAEREVVELFAEHGDPRMAESFFYPLGHPAGDRLLAALKTRYELGGRGRSTPASEAPRPLSL